MKTIFFATAFFLIVTASGAYAVRNESGEQAETTTREQVQMSSSSAGNQVQNRNEVETRNQGEETQIRTNTQEKENLSASEGAEEKGLSEKGSPRNENAREHMSVVAQKVEELLNAKATQGGIGEEVRQIAQEQKQSQVQIQEELDKVDKRQGLAKIVIGPDYQALKVMQQQIEENKLRIEQLTRLQTQLANEGDAAMVRETVRVLTEQNTALQERIDAENRSGSLFGWLFRWFVR